MCKKYALLCLLFWGLSLPSQSLIYSENFDAQNGKGAIGSSSGAVLDTSNISWSLNVDQCFLTASTDWFQVNSNRLEARDIDGEAIWLSPLISTAGFQAWELNLNAFEQGSLEISDYLITEFSIDGGSWQAVVVNAHLQNDFSSAQVFHFGEAASTLQLRLRFLNNADAEYIQVDDIEVLAYQELLFSNGAWNRIPDQYTAAVDGRISSGSLVVPSQDFKLKNLSIEAGGELRLNPGLTAEIAEGIQNDGLFILHSGSALLQSAASNLNLGSGSYQVERSHIAPDHQRFSFWSSPVANAKMEVVFANTNSLDRYEYLASSQSFSAYPTGDLMSGHAYACTPSQQSNASTNFTDYRVFTGDIHNGTYSLSISGISGGDWLLLGNPYPCPIEFQALVALNPALMGSVHFWDASTPQASGAAYASWTALGANAIPFSARGTPSNYIPAMQGFMVQIDPSFNGNSLNIQFENSIRRSNTLSSNPSFFKKEVPTIRLWLSLADSLQGRSTLIAFHPSASDQIDPKLDAVLPFQSMGALSLSSYSHDSILLAIQAQGPLSLVKSKQIPIAIENHLKAGVQLKLDSIQSPIPLQISLIDKYLGQKYPLDERQAYVLQDTGSFIKRFQIEVMAADEHRTLTERHDSADIHFHEEEYYWSFFGPEDQSIQLKVFTLSGSLVYQDNKERGLAMQKISKQALPSGILLLQYQSEGTQAVLKFYNSKP